MTKSLIHASAGDGFRPTLEKDGYVVLTDLFNPADVRALHDAVCALFEQQLADGCKRGRALIGSSYRSHREAWQASARQMHNLLELFQISSSDKVRLALRTAGLASPVMCIHPEMRVDVPQDTQYMQPWHQDWRSGQGSLNSVTIWMPLHDVSSQDGAIELIPGSHLWGLTETEELSDPRSFVCKDARLKGQRGLIAELRQGECVLFSQMLVHRSGSNTSKLPRLTAQLRYADLEETSFRKNLYRAPAGSELVWPLLPSSEAMKHVYSTAN